MASLDDLVTVVIPAYNAEKTLGETLRSVCNQTHRALEILVIDDGSKDRTAEVAEAHAKADQRIRLITKPNGGVASARNLGIEEASSPIVAPVDADDLWRPRKIERQLRALRAAGPETGLVYSWSMFIDEDSKIMTPDQHPSYAGDVFTALLYGNFVGNGSSALMRRSLVLDAGGYDPSLRERKAQGCEDWKLYLLLAERSHFAVVPDHLVGYRMGRAAMSGDVSQMLRSDAIVREEMLERHPNYATELKAGRSYYIEWLLRREVDYRNWSNCRQLLQERDAGKGLIRVAARRAKLAARFARSNLRKRRSLAAGRDFLYSAGQKHPALDGAEGAFTEVYGMREPVFPAERVELQK